MAVKQNKTEGSLQYIHPSKILPNPDNPRIIFRQEEMESLLVSIDNHGIQVPINVYKSGKLYYLIDGERRWRCAKKMNLHSIPAMIQQKPTQLENLLLMSNIHALREQWDYFTIAINLKRIIELFIEELAYEPNEIELSKETGLTRGQIRRCHLLLDLPQRFKDILLEELELPKSQQKISEDFFIEMERSLKTVVKRIPEFGDNIDEIRHSLIDKFKTGIIDNITDFRQLSKIATAIENIGVRKNKAKIALTKLFDANNNIGIRDVYTESVGFGYDEQRAYQQLEYINEYLAEIIQDQEKEKLDQEFIELLSALYSKLKTLLED